MKLLFIGDFRFNSGSSHVIHNYIKAAAKRGWEARISSQYGSLDSEIQKIIPVCADLRWADRLVVVFETKQFLKSQDIEQIAQVFPRKNIIIIDPDGRYGERVERSGDSNHAEYIGDSWLTLYQSLSDIVLQPKLNGCSPNAHFFSYHGIESGSLENSFPEQKVSVQYIGNNWYRWPQVKSFLLSLKQIRPSLKQIVFQGKWWDGTVCRGHEIGTFAETDLFRELSIDVYPSVPFGEVVSEMSKSLISPIFVRPMLSAQSIITPRMFETLAATTIPLIMEEDHYVAKLYGDESATFFYDEGKIEEIISNPERFLKRAHVIREDIYSKFNYEVLLTKLVSFFG